MGRTGADGADEKSDEKGPVGHGVCGLAVVLRILGPWLDLVTRERSSFIAIGAHTLGVHQDLSQSNITLHGCSWFRLQNSKL